MGRAVARTRWRRVGRIVGVSIVLLGAVLLASVFRLDGPTAQQGQTRAAPLIAALERYRQTEGAYPQRIESVVPTYLAAVPRAAWRYPYFYVVCPDSSVYILLFRPGGHSDLTTKVWGYSSATQAWKFGAGGPPPYFYETPCLGYMNEAAD